jgi:hypothetical protein
VRIVQEAIVVFCAQPAADGVGAFEAGYIETGATEIGLEHEAVVAGA